MWEFLLLLIVVFLLLILSAVYIVRLGNKIIRRYVKNRKLSFILSVILLLVFILSIFIDVVNTTIIYIHFILLIFLSKLLFFLGSKITKKKVNEYTSIGFGALVAIIVLIYGYYSVYNVVETDYEVYTLKDIGSKSFRIVQISDSHLGNTLDGKKLMKYINDINKLNPDTVVITGDFVDDETSYNCMRDGAKDLGKLKTKYGVYFVFGNHDKGYYNRRGYTEKQLREELEKNKVIILEDKVVDITDSIVILGRQDAGVNNRVVAEKLTETVDKNKYIITLDHQPNDYDGEIKAQMDLVLSGHTHGGQLFPLGQLGVLFGINDNFYGIENRNKTTFIVNSGISDWALKFKTGAISEYTVIDIKKKK